MRTRAAIGAGLAAVFWATLSAPCLAQDVVKFPATDSDRPYQVYLRGELLKPQGPGPFPAVVLMHGCGGWQPAVHYALEAHAEFLSEHGFAVLDLDSFGPRHDAANAMCASDARLRRALVYRAYDAFDAMRYLRSLPFIDARNIFLMGQSNGGSVALEAASASGPARYNGGGPRFRAAVAYYPWCGVFGGSPVRLVSPLLIFSGGKDDWVSTRQCTQSRTTGASFQVRVYPNAVHSFDVNILHERYLGHLVGYDAPAAEDSETRMLGFFEKHLERGRRDLPVMAAALPDTLRPR